MKTITILYALLFSTLCAFGEVNFNLNFTDNPGSGFKKKENEWMMDEAKKASKLIGKLFKQNATINIKINANDQTNYACSPTEHYYIDEEKHGKKVTLKAQYKILNNLVSEINDTDGHIEFNVSQFDPEKPGEFSLTLLHEMTHVLGFLNCQDPRQTEMAHYTDFDKLLHDKNGNRFLINKGDPDGHYFINPKFDGSLDMYAGGPFIRKQNNGKFLKIHNPPLLEKGSSYTHLDADMHAQSIMTSQKSSEEYQLWNNCELGILQELGYEIDWENYIELFHQVYPSTVTIDIDREVLEEMGTEPEVIINSDFPQTCCKQNLNKKDETTLSFCLNKESKLVLVDKETRSHLVEIKPYAKNLSKTLFIKKRKYKIDLTEKLVDGKKEINITLKK